MKDENYDLVCRECAGWQGLREWRNDVLCDRELRCRRAALLTEGIQVTLNAADEFWGIS